MRCPSSDNLPAPKPDRREWPWVDSPQSCAQSAPTDAGLPRITIVTPSFNQAPFLEETIRSVLLQGYPDLEYIIIDGGSTDGSTEVIRTYQQHLAFWCSESDRGQSHAINKGMARATGMILGWLCSDDILLPGALHAVGSHFATHPACKWLSGAGEFRRLENEQITRRPAGVVSPTALLEFWKHGEPGHYFPQPSTFWRSDLWSSAGGVSEENHLAMDYELWLRFLDMAAPHVLDATLSVSRLHADCKSVHHRREQVRVMMRCAYDRAGLRPYGKVRLTTGMIKWLAGRQWQYFKRQARNGRWTQAVAELIRLARHSARVWGEEGRLNVFRFQ